MAAPAFLAAGTATESTGAIPLPAGLTEDDVVLLAAMSGNDAVSYTGPPSSGYTLIDEIFSANMSAAWWWKRAGASESSPTITRGAGGAVFIGQTFGYRGCIGTGTPFEDATTAGAPTQSANPQTAAIDTADVDRLVVSIACIDDDTAWDVAPPPAGWTQDSDFNTAGSTDGRVVAMSIPQATTGAVSAANFGTLAVAEFWRTLTLALIPPAAPASDLPRQPVIAGRAVARASRW